nr:MAG TPA: hypothetical protein [Caudoviricetes sp.]DAP18107.1 MAG TPA: hypothetical protein [Caudoviricetes sp.]
MRLTPNNRTETNQVCSFFASARGLKSPLFNS